MVFIVAAAAGLAAVLIVIILSGSSRNEKRMLAKLLALEEAGQFGEAIHIARRLVDDHPLSAGYNLRLSQLYEKNKNIAMAVSIAEEMYDKSIVSREVSRVAILENILRLSIKASNWEEAFRVAYELLRFNAGNSHALTALGRIYGSQGDLATSLEMFEAANRTSARDPEARFYYALALLDTGEMRKALIELEAALKSSPSDRNILYFTGCAYFQTGQNEKAATVLSKIGVEGFDTLPKNILKIAILRQNMPKLDLGTLKIRVQSGAGPDGRTTVRSVEDLASASGESLHAAVLRIAERLDCTVKEELRLGSMDPNVEKNLLCVNRESSTPLLFTFLKTNADLGIIPVTTFLQYMEDRKLKKGLLVTTGHLSSAASEELKRYPDVTVVDRSRVGRFLR